MKLGFVREVGGNRSGYIRHKDLKEGDLIHDKGATYKVMVDYGKLFTLPLRESSFLRFSKAYSVTREKKTILSRLGITQ